MVGIGSESLITTQQDDVAGELFAGYPDLLTPAHIAELTGFTVQYVRRLCREQRLPAVQIGSRDWFVPKVRFVEYVMGGGDG